MSETICLRLSKETIKKLQDIAGKEQKDRSTLVREIIDKAIKERNIDYAISLYQKGKATGMKAAKIADLSLWQFYKILEEKGILIQYSQKDLEEDLKP
jgi:predicted HTH domain antitoxin